MIRLKDFRKFPLGLGVCAVIALTGCDGGGPGLGLVDRTTTGGGLFSGRAARTPVAPPTEARLVGGDVVVPAPAGWCVEPKSLRARGQSGFALFAGCAALTEGQSGPWVPSGVLTATVSRRRAAGDLVAQEALSAAVGDGRILDQQLRDGVALVHLAPATAASDAGLGDPHWRAVFVHQGRAISLAAYGPAGGDISRRSGGELLLFLARGIRSNTSGTGS
ncbi:MAG: hypothetical protein EP318_06040 [Rhodobacteraceae bacterium]|nr:MAG: hypothetical protein EP318_06040 [Paracoccaceae bacterium]